jgi:hypothetical protein
MLVLMLWKSASLLAVSVNSNQPSRQLNMIAFPTYKSSNRNVIFNRVRDTYRWSDVSVLYR